MLRLDRLDGHPSRIFQMYPSPPIDRPGAGTYLEASSRSATMAHAKRGFGPLSGPKLLDGRYIMKTRRSSTIVGRRGLLRTMITGAAAAAAADAVSLEPGSAKPSTDNAKRRARYQPNSAEVQDFYRVNRYPPH